MFPIYVRKYRKYTIDRWAVVYTGSVCFRGQFVIKTVVGFTTGLRKRKLVWNCVIRWSIFFMCNTFSCWLVLLSLLYIELALVSCWNPDNVHCFGTIFSNLKFVFLHQSAPPVPPWLNYVPRKMPDVRSRYTRFTNVRRFMYCMLHFMYECSALFTSRSTYLTTTSNFFRKIVKSTFHPRPLKAHDRCHRSIGLLLLMCFCNLGHWGILLGSKSQATMYMW